MPQLDGCSSRSTGSVRAHALADGGQLEALLARLVQHRAPAMSGPRTTSGRAVRCPGRSTAARAGADRRVARPAARCSEPRSRARGRAPSAPPRPVRARGRCSTAAGRGWCAGVVAVAGGDGIAGELVATPTGPSASRSVPPPTPAAVSTGSSCSGAPKPCTAVWSTQVTATPTSASSRSSPGAYAHSGSHSPPPRHRSGARGTRCRRPAEPHARIAGQQRKQRVGGGRGPQLHRRSRSTRASAPSRSRSSLSRRTARS